MAVNIGSYLPQRHSFQRGRLIVPEIIAESRRLLLLLGNPREICIFFVGQLGKTAGTSRSRTKIRMLNHQFKTYLAVNGFKEVVGTNWKNNKTIVKCHDL